MARMPALQGVSEVRRAETITDGLDACFAGSLRSEKSRDHNRWLRCLPRRVFQKREGQRAGESQGGGMKFERKPLWICEKLGGQPGY